MQSKSSIQSFRQIFFIYISTIFLFAILYVLPISQSHPIPWLDSLFLSTSALSVTGLTTITVAYDLTKIGQTFLLIEMQLGGIGIIVLISYLFLMMDKRLTMSNLLLLSKDQNQNKLGSITSLGLSVLLISLIVEAICFAFVYKDITALTSSTKEAIFVAIFHSVASFTNSGFDLFGESLVPFQQNRLFLMTTAFTIFLGSIGYPTIVEYIFSFKQKKSLFSRINIRMHTALLVLGVIIYYALEHSRALSHLPLLDKVTNAIFLSATSRNGGFSTFSISTISMTTMLILMFLMFTGGASSSAGGGIRLTTFAVLLAKLESVIKSQEHTVIYRKTISDDTINKAFMVFFSFITLLFIATIILTLFETEQFTSIIFEVMSALTNTGLSLGITHELHSVSKIVLIMLMVIGRIGVFSLIYSIFKIEKTKARYLKEDLPVG